MGKNRRAPRQAVGMAAKVKSEALGRVPEPRALSPEAERVLFEPGASTFRERRELRRRMTEGE